jgi:hypothetical protein
MEEPIVTLRSCGCLAHQSVAVHSRRRFLRTALVSTGAALVGTALPLNWATAAGKAEALLLSCMDYRLIDDIERYMGERGLRGKYDHAILAGASLGALTEAYPAWNQTFWEHLGCAIKMHHVHKAILMDHRDCGAYKLILGQDISTDPVMEREEHALRLRELRGLIVAKYPDLGVEMLLMGLDGKVETIS